MTPPTPDHAWQPASPAQLASTLLTSLQHVTSSARLFLAGCFQCGFLKAGCWRRQEEQDGAWFDCDKVGEIGSTSVGRSVMDVIYPRLALVKEHRALWCMAGQD